MKAVILKANNTLVYDDMPTPEVSEGCVRIRVAVCGICGSDVPRVFDNAAHNYPTVLGHEFSGVVDAVGTGVSKLQVGDHVVAAPLIPCHECEDCKQGNYSLCSHYSFVGSRQQGAMADYVVVPAQNVIRISKDIPFDQAATIEPATVALHALRLVNFTAGKSVAVIGCGIIGHYAIQWAKLLGASSVIAIGRGEKGLSTAKALGAEECYSTAEITEDELLKQLDSRGYDYVIECSGAEATIHMALKIVAKKGTVCYVGTPKNEIAFSVKLWENINRKECIVTGSWMSYSAPFPGEEWNMSVEFMENKKLKIVPGMVYEIFPMENAMEAFLKIRKGITTGRLLLENRSI